MYPEFKQAILSSVARRAPRIVVLVALAACSAVHADSATDEIDFLLSAVEHSGCHFVRNGKTHTAAAAADHLRLKYKRGRKWAKTAENFIERLATKSSWSGKLYSMRCPGEPETSTADWLQTQLAGHRREH